MKYRLITCEVFYREMCYAISQSPHQIDVHFLPKGLHDIGAKPMSERIQAVLDEETHEEYDAVLFGYGLCNNGLVGLTARKTQVVIPRAHDCITLFLGSKERYMEYFNAHQGVYFETTGWLERGEGPGELSQLSIQRQIGMDMQYEELVRKYGEDNAKYLWETLCDTTHNYGQYTFIEMGIEPNDSFERLTKEKADERGWTFEKVKGDMRLIWKLVNGNWDEKEFLVLQPGQKVTASYQEDIIRAETE